MSKTIRDLADELGISKQAVTKRIDNLGCRDELVLVGGQFQINEDTEAKIKGYTSTDNSKVSANFEIIANRQLSPTVKLVDTISEQILAKDVLISKQEEQIKQLQHELAEKDQEISSLRITAALYEKIKEEIEELKADKLDLQQHRDNLTNALMLSKSDLARLENIITQMASLPLGTRIFGWSGAIQALTDKAMGEVNTSISDDVVDKTVIDVEE